MDLGCETERTIKEESLDGETEECGTEDPSTRTSAHPHDGKIDDSSDYVHMGSSPVQGVMAVEPASVYNGKLLLESELAEEGHIKRELSSPPDGNVENCEDGEIDTPLDGQAEDPSPDVNVGTSEDSNHDVTTATQLNTSSSPQSRTKKRKKLSSGGDKNLYCEFCSYACTRPSDFQRHVRIHTGERPFACHLCDHRASRASHLKNHLRTHTGEKPYKCNMCDYTCAGSSHLKVHMRAHSGERPHACGVCGLTFKRGHDLTVHERLHTGERPYVCTYCGFASNRPSHLKYHMKTKRHLRLKGLAPDVPPIENIQ